MHYDATKRKGTRDTRKSGEFLIASENNGLSVCFD
jgi:hypothetical protein